MSEDGTLIATGTRSERVRVFQIEGDSWVQRGSDIAVDTAEYVPYVSAIAMSASGETLVVGTSGVMADWMSDAGAARVYRFEGGEWVPVGEPLLGQAEEDRFGESVAMSDDGLVIALGVYGRDTAGENAGAVAVYRLEGEQWIPQGTEISGKAAGELLGASIAMSADGNTIVASKYLSTETADGLLGGRVYGFEGGSWVQLGEDIDNSSMGYISDGIAISGDGTKIALGGSSDKSGGTRGGRVRVFSIVDGVWTPYGQELIGEVSDQLGKSLWFSADGSTLAVGGEGKAVVYRIEGDTWVQQGPELMGSEPFFDQFGSSIAMSENGDRLVVSAPSGDGANGSEAGWVQVYERQE